jgi:hypothetical protein
MWKNATQARRPVRLVDGFRPAGRVRSTPVGRFYKNLIERMAAATPPSAERRSETRTGCQCGEPRSSRCGIHRRWIQELDLVRRRDDARTRLRRAVRRQLPRIYVRRSRLSKTSLTSSCSCAGAGWSVRVFGRPSRSCKFVRCAQGRSRPEAPLSGVGAQRRGLDLPEHSASINVVMAAATHWARRSPTCCG